MTLSEVLKSRRKSLGLTLAQIADEMGVTEATVQRWESGNIKSLRHEKISRLAKILKVSPAYLMGWEDTVPQGFDPLPRTTKIPLVGSIACGEPITAEENVEDYVDAPSECHPDFALRCKGESMIEAGISDGDIVYIQKVVEVRNGEIAAVRIGDEATLKYLYWDHGVLTLVPTNKAMSPRTYSGEALEDIHIEGKAVGFTHWF